MKCPNCGKKISVDDKTINSANVIIVVLSVVLIIVSMALIFSTFYMNRFVRKYNSIIDAENVDNSNSNPVDVVLKSYSSDTVIYSCNDDMSNLKYFKKQVDGTYAANVSLDEVSLALSEYENCHYNVDSTGKNNNEKFSADTINLSATLGSKTLNVVIGKTGTNSQLIRVGNNGVRIVMVPTFYTYNDEYLVMTYLSGTTGSDNGHLVIYDNAGNIKLAIDDVVLGDLAVGLISYEKRCGDNPVKGTIKYDTVSKAFVNNTLPLVGENLC